MPRNDDEPRGDVEPGPDASAEPADDIAVPDRNALPEGAVLRLIDANANRAREALRVLEDYARFVLDAKGLSGDLKALRHDLRAALASVLPEAILHRDTPGDVGTTTKTVTELVRADLGDVVVAAGKRLGEALRSIEEYLKTIDPEASAQVESLRYRFYDVERRLLLTVRPRACLVAEVDLYVLITESVCAGRPWLDVAGDALEGGADCLQLREKDLESGELLRRAKQLVQLCQLFGVPCVINDRPDIAVLSGAAGVHVGQGDLPAAEARKIVGPRRLVGVSTHEIAHAKQAVLDGADYVGVGPFFKSTTKPRDFTAGPEYARRVAEQIQIPAVAIAGITAENVDQVLATGVRAIAVSSAVTAAPDVRAAAAALKAKLRRPGHLYSERRRVPQGPQDGGHRGGQTFLSVTRDPKAASNENPLNASRPSNDPRTQPLPARSATPLATQPPLPRPAAPRPAGASAFAEQLTRRHLPHWSPPGATYFVTFRSVASDLDDADRGVVLDHIKSGHGPFYALVGVVVMPDQVHAVLAPNDGVSLSRVTKGTKGVLARLINQRRQRTGHVWQDESWDRVIRGRDDLYEKLKYMLDNPVRKGLVADGWAYPWWYYNPKR